MQWCGNIRDSRQDYSLFNFHLPIDPGPSHIDDDSDLFLATLLFDDASHLCQTSIRTYQLHNLFPSWNLLRTPCIHQTKKLCLSFVASFSEGFVVLCVSHPIRNRLERLGSFDGSWRSICTWKDARVLDVSCNADWEALSKPRRQHTGIWIISTEQQRFQQTDLVPFFKDLSVKGCS